MRRHLIALGLVYSAFVLEAAAVGADATGVQPRWLALAAAGLLWTQPLPMAVLWGGVCGLLGDALLSGQPGIGVAVVSASVWGLGLLKASRRWKSAIPFLLTTFALTAITLIGTRGLLSLWEGESSPDWRRLALTSGGQGAMTALWGAGLAAVYRSLAAIGRRILPPLDWRRAGSAAGA